MAVHVRGPWGLSHCVFLRRNHVEAPRYLSLPEGLRRLNFSAVQAAQATTAATREFLAREGYVNEAARAQLLDSSNSSNASEAKLCKGRTLSSGPTTSGNSTGASSNSAGGSSCSDSSIGDDNLERNEEDAEALQDAVEKSFSVFDIIYKNASSQSRRRRTVSATQTTKPTSPTTTEPEDAQRAAAPTQSLPVPFPSSKTKEGPAVLLSVLRDLTNARIRTPEAWTPPLLLLMQQLPLLSSSEVQQAAALLAASGCRPPLLLQGLCEAFRWRVAAKQTEASQTILFLDSLRRLRYLPCGSHLLAYFGSLERRRKCLSVSDLLKIQRFLDELSVPSELASMPFVVSILPQLKRNTAALKPPEAAALASLLLKRQELDRETAECLSAAVYEHLGGASSFLLLQQEPFPSVGALNHSHEQSSDHLKSQYHQDMLQRQQERLASPSSLSCLLHLGKSLAAANLKQLPSAFCWAVEREVELHWAAMTPTEVSATLK
ncbi:hypothetical protein, conserved [Eimeria praecox]|uniref:Uncharacterized protein n=1 Tax=Eimeria praecox TaxID=51316 RepID=U6H269_9EIME|nr:hypothetical protein, conserved [Eimeria praecox]